MVYYIGTLFYSAIVPQCMSVSDLIELALTILLEGSINEACVSLSRH